MKKRDNRLSNLFISQFGSIMETRIRIAESHAWDKLGLIYTSCITEDQKKEITKKRIAKIQKKLKKCPSEIVIYLRELLSPYALNSIHKNNGYDELIEILARNFFTEYFYDDLEQLNQKKEYLDKNILKVDIYEIEWDYYFRSTELFENQILLYEFEYYFSLGLMLIGLKEFDFIEKNNFEGPSPSENPNEESEKQRNFEKAIEVYLSPETIKKRFKPFSPLSFTYKHIATYPEKLNDLRDILVKKNFIAPQTNIRDFKKVFSGEEIKTKVIWTGNISELYFFIKYLHNDSQKVEYLKQKQWEVTLKCFQLNDSRVIDKTKLRSQKPPSTKIILQNIINQL
jgi:hypothetical protein